MTFKLSFNYVTLLPLLDKSFIGMLYWHEKKSLEPIKKTVCTPGKVRAVREMISESARLQETGFILPNICNFVP